MADETMDEARCRNCGNTGISPWTGAPCGCKAGKALATALGKSALMHHQQPQPITVTGKVEITDYGQQVLEQMAEANKDAPPEPRAIIQAFAVAMERKLAANDGVKGGWRDTGTFKLRSLAVGELTEFLNALHELINLEDANAPESVLADARQALLLEAGDTANYLMMICDVVGALPPTDERGR